MLQSLLSPIPTLEQLAPILIKRRENWGIRLKVLIQRPLQPGTAFRFLSVQSFLLPNLGLLSNST